MPKIILISVIDKELNEEEIDKILNMYEDEEPKDPNESNSDIEDHKYSTPRDRFDAKDLKSKINSPSSLKKHKHSLTISDRQRFIKRNLIFNSGQSQVSSWVRLDQVEKLKPINNSIESKEEQIITTRNVANLDLYISSNRMEAESIDPNWIKQYSFRRSKRVNISNLHSEWSFNNDIFISVGKAQASEVQSRHQHKNSDMQNEEMPHLSPINIIEDCKYLDPASAFISQLKAQLQDKFKSPRDSIKNPDGQERKRRLKSSFWNSANLKNNSIEEGKESDMNGAIVDYYPESSRSSVSNQDGN